MYDPSEFCDIPERWPLIVWINNTPFPAYRLAGNGKLLHRRIEHGRLIIRKLHPRESLKLQWPWIMSLEDFNNEIKKSCQMSIANIENPMLVAYPNQRVI